MEKSFLDMLLIVTGKKILESFFGKAEYNIWIISQSY